ncbi:MAG: serine/threonine protein phosphatase [Armatimonadetes bacterium]|nr:serine/threonine protein phosphatase [Armatimonadota bacterium]
MIYAVGDIHGEAGALRALLEELPVQPSDLVVFLGDAINRGPDGCGCVEQILAFDRCRKVFLQGNHEEAMLMFLEEGAVTALTGMDAQPTLDAYAAAGYALTPGDLSSLPESHLRLYAQAYPWTLPFYITDDYIFTHAGWDLFRPLQMQNLGVLRWGKVTGQESPFWTQTVVRGHVPVPQVTFARRKQYIGVDTGCGLGGLLSAVALPTEEVYTARPASFRPDWYSRLRG